jgi:hypothetical protein
MTGVTIEIPGSQQVLNMPTVGGTWKMTKEP